MKREARLSYVWEKLYTAINSGVFNENHDAMAECFHVVSRGIENDDKAWWLNLPRTRELADKILALIKPSPEDLERPGGGWPNRARRMTREERSELGSAMVSLYTEIMDADRERAEGRAE